jgi:hypothetical protein
MRIITVAMNPAPKVNATSRRRFLSIKTICEYSVADDKSSDAISKMIAITASQRLRSEIDSGKLMFSLPSRGTKPRLLVCR